MTSDNSNEILPVVDEAGNVIGSATRGECHDGSGILHPVVHLHLFDASGRIFLQLRPLWKKIQPGKWDTAVGGHVDLGETVMDALRRETREELGLIDIKPDFIARYIFESSIEKELVNAFMAVSGDEPVPGAELAGGRFWTLDEINEALGKDILTPNFEKEFRFLNLSLKMK